MHKHIFIAPILFFIVFSCKLSFAQSACSATIFSGIATYYTATSTSSCSFDTTETGSYYCAINQSQYDTAAYCGTCLSVTGGNGTHIVVVNDVCPSCAMDNLDMSPVAFQSVVGDLSLGTGTISWKLVSCPYASTPLWITNNAASNAYYASVLVHHAVNKIAGVEAYFDSSWHIMSRSVSNYWTSSLTNDTMLSIRVTDIYGSQIVVDSVKTNAFVNFSATSNFTACITTAVTNVVAPADQAYVYYNNQRLWLQDNEGFQSVILTDLSGKIIYAQNFDEPKSQCGIQVEQFSAGMYLIQLRSPEAPTKSLKWVKAQ